MEIIQIPLSKMALFAYLAGDPESGTCAVIDPSCDTERILTAAREKNWNITQVINTHGHADHTSGNAAMIRATGATLSIHRLDAPALSTFLNKGFTFFLGGRPSPKADRLLEDGDEIVVGASRLKVIHTPGHTRGGICLYTPGHVITGDTLFAGSVGRTDLAGGSLEQLVCSVRERIYSLPGEALVWPGHNYGPKPSSTVQFEKANNPFT